MKRYDAQAIRTKAYIGLVILCTLIWAFPGFSSAQEPPKIASMVAASEGEATVLRDQAEDETKLATGDTIHAWDAVHTQEKSKLLLRWDNGLVTSLGAFSSLGMTWGEPHGRPTPVLQVPEGIVRFARKQGEEQPIPYLVTTPNASIEPDTSDGPADFIVETYEPSATVVTVIAGRVKVKSFKQADSQESVVLPCQTAYIEDGKKKIEILSVRRDVLQKLVDDSTIQGTIFANLDVCPLPQAQAEAPVPPTVVVQQPYWSGTYVEPWPYCDDWFNGITVAPYPALPDCILVNVPYFGDFVVNVPSYGPWACDPAIVTPFIQNWFYRHAWGWHQRWGEDWRLRRREAFGLIHVAQATRDPRLWWRARRELNYLHARSRWDRQRVHGFEGHMRGLSASERRARWRIPAGVNFERVIDDSFRSGRNAAALRNFNQRLREDATLQNRLTRSGELQASGLASRMAREADPGSRLAMRQNLSEMRRQLAQGRLPVSKQNAQIGTLVSNLRNTSDPLARQQATERLSRDLARLDRTQPSPLVSGTTLAALRGSAGANLMPAARQRFDRGISELERTMQTRGRAQNEARQYNRIIDQAAREKNPQRRDALMSSVRSLNDRNPATSRGVGNASDRANVRNGLKSNLDRLQRDWARSQRDNGALRSRQMNQSLRQLQEPRNDSAARRRWNADREQQITARQQQLNRLSIPQASPSRQQRRAGSGMMRSAPQAIDRLRQGSFNPSNVNRERRNRSQQGVRRQSSIQRSPQSMQQRFRQPAHRPQFRQPQRPQSHRQFRQPSAQVRRNSAVRHHAIPHRSGRSSGGSHSSHVRAPSGQGGHSRRR